MGVILSTPSGEYLTRVGDRVALQRLQNSEDATLEIKAFGSGGLSILQYAKFLSGGSWLCMDKDGNINVKNDGHQLIFQAGFASKVPEFLRHVVNIERQHDVREEQERKVNSRCRVGIWGTIWEDNNRRGALFTAMGTGLKKIGALTVHRTGDTNWIYSKPESDDALSLKSRREGKGIILFTDSGEVICRSGHWVILKHPSEVNTADSVVILGENQDAYYYAKFEGGGGWLCLDKDGALNVKNAGDWVYLRHSGLGAKSSL
ncbi:hypothetical protein N7448_005909 [Penicillium atrosanguineum]|nr:hypothetical protein N7448_005909 [Penicillium atrosanguineum]KAJ5138044.1 hypothetical protein N7526_004277 [Penicillium atrosanguineum]